MFSLREDRGNDRISYLTAFQDEFPLTSSEGTATTYQGALITAYSLLDSS